MSETNLSATDKLLLSIPGGIAKLAIDNELTILHATDTFYSLIKNATEKSSAKMPGALLRIVYSADIIYVTQQIAAQKHRKDNLLSFNFRILQSNGSFKWVMINGAKTEEVHASGTKSVPVYSCIAMNATDHMINYKKLEQDFEYHRTISELSKELYFIYEIATNTLNFTELFREVFGRDSEIKEFSKRLEKTSMILPEELPAVIKIFKSMMGGKKQVRFEVRLIPKGGEPTWYVCYASIIFDENRNPFRVIGKLATINSRKKEIEPAAPQPQLDTLTKVYTKEYADKSIIEHMAKQEPEAISALMLVEVRNYKGLNEIMKTVNGENILTSVAGILRSNLRITDVIGRSSLSEFVVYLKDIRTSRIAFEKAEKLCKEIEALYCYEHNKGGLTISMGIAFTKGDNMDYSILLANAKTALVMAKKESSSAFEVFSGGIL